MRLSINRSRQSCQVVLASTATITKTVKIGTRGSPLALAQAYLTRDLLKVRRQKLLFFAHLFSCLASLVVRGFCQCGGIPAVQR